ncbi:MAG: DUF2892 domain-containing protein [Bacteroidetes bacterium]|nr:DUF2892 domain-containing protein [Bacteroidota bacterium]
MNKNVGQADRVIRILIGLVLIGLTINTELSIVVNWLLWIAAGLLIGTAAFSRCLIYWTFGLSTLKVEQKD